MRFEVLDITKDRLSYPEAKMYKFVHEGEGWRLPNNPHETYAAMDVLHPTALIWDTEDKGSTMKYYVVPVRDLT